MVRSWNSSSTIAEKASATWSDGVWKESGGGGTVWDAITYDPTLDLVFVGVGNGAPWNHKLRSGGRGDNLFLASIVALRPDWHSDDPAQGAIKVVMTGVGAAGVAVTDILLNAGVAQVIGCDHGGAIWDGRPGLNAVKQAYAERTNAIVSHAGNKGSRGGQVRAVH